MPLLTTLWNIVWIIALGLLASAGLVALLILNVGALFALRTVWRDFRRGK